jgi:RNA polymerase subunit RPABC4/transcription elongation factor Spt4
MIVFRAWIGDAVLMVTLVRDVSEPPLMWSIPFTILLITLILAAADTLFPFIPINVGAETWMWAASTLITSIVASLVTEIISEDNRKAMLSMGIATIFFTLIYPHLSKLLQKSLVNVVHGAIPNPFLGTAVYVSLLAVVPSALTGAVLGGVFGTVPITFTLKGKSQTSVTIPEVKVPQLPGFEKLCNRCGHYAPFESKFCPYCGIELMLQRAPTIQYCRFCGARINYLGQFCPECGKEIDIISKPHVYVSK